MATYTYGMGAAVITIAKCNKIATYKKPLLLYCKNGQRVLLPKQKLRKTNLKISILLLFLLHHPELKNHSMYMSILR